MNRIWIYESEIRAIAHETLSWQSETGGDLFGKWGVEPVIFLATRAGPNTVRSRSQCRFDLPYLETLGTQLTVVWNLAYFGDWHSHYMSGTTRPGRTDRDRLGHLMHRLRIDRILELITNLSRSWEDDLAKVSVHGYDFRAATVDCPDALRVSVMPGVSPVREILSRRNGIAAQDWDAWESVPLEFVSGFAAEEVPDDDFLWCQRDLYSRRVIAQLVQQLEAVFQEPVVDTLHPGGREFSITLPTMDISAIFTDDWPFPFLQATCKAASHQRIVSRDPNGITILQPHQVVELLEGLIANAHQVLASESVCD